MKNVNATIRNGRVHLKSFPDSKFARVDRRAKPISEEYNYEAVIMTSKQPRIGRFDDLPKLYEKMAHACQEYNIAKIFVLPYTFASIPKINKDVENCVLYITLSLLNTSK